MQETIYISSAKPKILEFEYNFSYIIIQKILFKSLEGKSYSISDILEYAPTLVVNAKTKKGNTIENQYYLPSHFDIYSVNPIINFRNESMVIPEFNFERDFISNEYVYELEMTLNTNNEDLQLILVFDKTPGVSIR